MTFRSMAIALLSFLVMGLVSLPARADAVPSSPRSRAAIARVKVGLEQALYDKGLRWGSPIFIRIFKESEELELWVKNGRHFSLFRTYPICSFSGSLGPKQKTGDMQSPEGFYKVPPISMNPVSDFYLSFNVGYPNAFDRYHGRTGSALMVHGSCVSAGCYAMTDQRIEEIYALADAALRAGQPSFPVHIFPFPLTEEEITRHNPSPWKPFWENLKQGYDLFEQTRIPPHVTVEQGKYSFYN